MQTDYSTRFYTMLAVWMLLVCAAAPAQAGSGLAQDRQAAVIIAYNRIGEEQYPATSIRTEQFDAHLRELTSGAYNLIALPELVAALESETTLPDRTVAITFDGGHRSILNQAVPALLRTDIPFTIFISTDHADRTTNEYLSWDDLRRLSRERQVTIGLHPASYIRLADEPAAERARQLNNARARFREELRQEPTFFAYPFGEYSAAYRELIAQQGFRAAFGQQSGVAWAGSDLLALPRFPMTDAYGGLDRFQMTATALPLPVTDIAPPDPHLSTSTPSIGFTVDPALADELDKLSCFVSHQGKPALDIIGQTRVELRLERPLEHDRARINCTLPTPLGEADEAPRWRWFGLLLTVPVPQPSPENIPEIDDDE